MPPPPARARWSLLFLTALALVLVADLGSKWWIFRLPAELVEAPLDLRMAWLHRHWAEISWIETHLNTGAAWSMGASTPWLIVALTVVLIPAMLWFYRRSFADGRAWEHWAFGAILGGALGNAYDRLLGILPGAAWPGVRDFVHVDLAVIGINYVWPTFNIADAGISLGACTLVLLGLLLGRPRNTNLADGQATAH